MSQFLHCLDSAMAGVSGQHQQHPHPPYNTRYARKADLPHLLGAEITCTVAGGGIIAST